MAGVSFRLDKLWARPVRWRQSSAGQEPGFFLSKHVQGDWGMMDPDDKQLNEEALSDGGRIHSAYKTLKGESIWIITEADRSTTTLLLPDDY